MLIYTQAADNHFTSCPLKLTQPLGEQEMKKNPQKLNNSNNRKFPISKAVFLSSVATYTKVLSRMQLSFYPKKIFRNVNRPGSSRSHVFRTAILNTFVKFSRNHLR